MSDRPELQSRTRTKAILRPSGDQTGPSPHDVLRASLRCPLPSAFMTQASAHDDVQRLLHPHLPLVLVKAIFCPSGDQAGSNSWTELCVKLRWSLPSAFMTRMSRWSP